jgi:uncharacterized LabA/DUF88 family protein
MEPKTEKMALFIDGANLYATAKSLGFDIDYKRLLSEFHSRGYLLRAFYYTAVIEDQEYSSIRPLIDWLDYNGYSVVTKATKEFVDQTGRRKVKGNMDIELAVDAMEIAGSIDHMVLFSGDGDFRSLVEAVQMRAAKIACSKMVISTWQSLQVSICPSVLVGAALSAPLPFIHCSNTGAPRPVRLPRNNPTATETTIKMVSCVSWKTITTHRRRDVRSVIPCSVKEYGRAAIPPKTPAVESTRNSLQKIELLIINDRPR